MKEMEASRKQSIKETEAISKELKEASGSLHKLRRAYEKGSKEVADARMSIENYHATTVNGNGKDLERLQTRLQKAEDALTMARQKFRNIEESHRNIHSKLYSMELPRIMSVSLLFLAALNFGVETATTRITEKQGSPKLHSGNG